MVVFFVYGVMVLKLLSGWCHFFFGATNNNFYFLLLLKKSGIIPLKISKKYLGNIWQQIVGANRDMSRKCALW